MICQSIKKNNQMENKTELLEKLGFTKEYLKMLDDNSNVFVLPMLGNIPSIFESNLISDLTMTSLIVEKSAKPINDNFIYNER